jgi:hypothetical protein
VRDVATRLLVWSLSPLGTLLNGVMLFAVMVTVGVRWDHPFLWLSVIAFLGACAYFDVRAYLARRRHGLTAYQAGEAVMERIWGPRSEPDEDKA